MGMSYKQHTTFIEDGASTHVSIKKSRVLYRIVLAELKPATDLVEGTFLDVVLQSMRCHLHLWTSGIHHRHISLGNVMYIIDEDGSNFGVLIDWDLAPDMKSTRNARKGSETVFLAVDLLASPDGSIEHLYRHDLEALFWVLLWVCYPTNTFAGWQSGTYDQCREKKSDYLLWGTQTSIKKKWVGLDVVLARLKQWLKRMSTVRDEHSEWVRTAASNRAGNLAFQEETPGEIWKAFCETLQGALSVMVGPEYEDTAKTTKNFLVHASIF